MALLKDGLDWPFPDNFEPENVPLLEWKPSEIGLDESAIPRLKRIEQIPKLTDKQPFGVFILDFEKGRLPIGAIRRLVNRLVHKKRATKSPGHALWNLSDLIFFCQSHEKVSTVHVVAFRDTGSVPVMKVISWDTEDSEVKIQLTVESLRKLQWPTTSSDADSWREEWQGAFTAGYREGISSAKKLAEHMAEVAKTVRDEVRKLLAIESESGPLRRLQSELKANLIADIDDAKFADMYAQTMVYGLLTARISHPEDFKAEGLNAVLKFENPFLDSLYSSFRKTGDEAFDVDEFGLHDLAETLGATNVEEVLADFGDENRKDDPVVFFYEDFLTNYDPEQRRELGAYYTPIPVVRFMVRAVDHIIKTEFDLPLGVADPTTWGEYSKAKKIAVPDGLTASDPVIRMIDPATGTGTFLLEWLRQAWANLGPKATDDQKLSVVERMDAFEISLSSYSVAHLKTGLELPPELRKSTRFDILLTDSLAGPRPDQASLFGDDPIADEGKRAEQVKFVRSHSIVIGNPPYLRTDRRNSGGWITDESFGRSPFEDVLAPARENTIFSHLRSLSNLYVYFWRWAIWKAFEQTRGGPAVVAFITASSWLTGPGFMGLRQFARQTADTIYVVDLGGDNLGTRPEEGVFDIQTPVSIVILVRRPLNKGGRIKIADGQYFRIGGSKVEKLAALETSTIDSVEWRIAPTGLLDRLVPDTGNERWDSFPAVRDLIPWQQPGCIHARMWPIAPDPALLERRWRTLVSQPDLETRSKWFVTAKTGRNIFTRVGSLNPIANLDKDAPSRGSTPYGFRSFDRQYTLDDPRVAKTESPSLWASRSNSQVFMVISMSLAVGLGPVATVSIGVPDYNYFNGRGGKDVFPLFSDANSEPNFDPKMADFLVSRFAIQYDSAHEMIYSYVYGVLAGSDFANRYLEELATPGPRIPLPANRELFESMAAHGAHLIWLQTYGERFRTAERQDLKIRSSIRWKKKPTVIPADPKACSYDAVTHSIHVADGILEGVSPEVWAFEVSGMKVIPKWLGYRTAKGTGKAVSSKSPLDHIRPTEWTEEWNHELRELVHVLTETLDLLPQGVLLLDQILDGPLISADELPEPPEELRKPPKAAKDSSGAMDFE